MRWKSAKVTCAASAIASRRVGTQHPYSYAFKTNAHREAQRSAETVTKPSEQKDSPCMRLTKDDKGGDHFCSGWTPRVLQVNSGIWVKRVLLYIAVLYVETTLRVSNRCCCVSMTALIRIAHHIGACGVHVSRALPGEAATTERQRAQQQQQANAAAAAAAALQPQHEKAARVVLGSISILLCSAKRVMVCFFYGCQVVRVVFVVAAVDDVPVHVSLLPLRLFHDKGFRSRCSQSLQPRIKAARIAATARRVQQLQ